jgi:TonB family protein
VRASHHVSLPDVYIVGEIARAAGVRPRDVRALVGTGGVRSLDGEFLTQAEAIRAVRRLARRATTVERSLFGSASGVRREPVLPAALSGAIHAAMLALAIAATTMTSASPGTRANANDPQEMRLVFLATPGPGGGGGGGGRNEPAPPARAERRGVSAARSPLPIRRPPPPMEAPKMVQVRTPPPPVKAEPLPQIVAPVVPVAGDTRDRVGVPAESAEPADSLGPGTGGGTGTGQGTGLGEGDGPGLGPGTGGGTGGGPYQPGSGISPPALLREVKPDYTEEGRRRGIEGEVVVEIVVRRDGRVGDVRLLRGLGAGLDERAIDAVRQWRFSPAERQGAPVDVMVEVSVEFRLR